MNPLTSLQARSGLAASAAASASIARFDRRCPDVYGNAHPQALLEAIREDGQALQALSNQHVVSSNQFDAQVLLQLFRLASKFESNLQRYIRFNSPLTGKLMINAFYEPSTRTRLSFASAWHRLGGATITITDRSTTGMAKGESLADIAEMFNNYGDCLVLRDSKADSIVQMMDSLRIPIINAGNGIDEHPTQAMADLYTIFKWRPELIESNLSPSQAVRIGIVGIPNRMRTVRSLLRSLARFPSMAKEVILFHEPGLDPMEEGNYFDPGQREELEDAGLSITTSSQLQDWLPELDVIYINAIAWIDDDYEVHGRSFILTSDLPYKKNAIILHPLARGAELDTSVDHTPHNWYFAQARGAVFIRMALLTCLVERTDQVMDII
jgi:aspartate carbamoyltransferase catalytic subunit